MTTPLTRLLPILPPEIWLIIWAHVEIPTIKTKIKVLLDFILCTERAIECLFWAAAGTMNVSIDGLLVTDPLKHIKEYQEICDNFKDLLEKQRVILKKLERIVK